jgi:hypothetical protein
VRNMLARQQRLIEGTPAARACHIRAGDARSGVPGSAMARA